MEVLMKNKLNLWIFIVASFSISLEVSSEIHKWTDDKGRIHYSDKAKNSKITHESNKTSKNTRIIKNERYSNKNLIGVHGENSDNVIILLRKYLQQKHYAKITRLLTKLSRFDVKDIRQELAFIRSFNAFYNGSYSYKSLLDRWIIQSPNNAFAYLARANYFYHLAWKYRGSRYAQNTKKNQFNSMESQFKNSEKDIIKALELNPKNIFGYYLGMSIAAVNGNSQLSDEYLEKGLRNNPFSFELRERLLYFKVPKWGGSVQEISDIANQFQHRINQNANLLILKSIAIRVVADILYGQKKYDKASLFYDQAIEKGKYYLNYFNRGKNSYKRKKYRNALMDYDTAIDLNPNDADLYYYRSFALTQLKQYKKGYKDIRSAILIDPGKPKYIKRSNYLRNSIVTPGINNALEGATSKKLETINATIVKNPNNAVLYFYRAKIFLKANKTESALNDLQRAIKLDPSRFEFHLLNDQILIKKNRVDEIINGWTKYLKIKPNDRRAYLERAGTYFHKRDIKNALSDAKKAMELGSESAVIFYNRLKML